MDTYRNALIILKSLLRDSGNKHWENWITQDIYDWDEHNSTSHHKGAFGGMGSINDNSVGSIWHDTLFDYVKEISWTFASKHSVEMPVARLDTLQGIQCKTCNYKETSDDHIEWFLSRKYLPEFISAYLPTDEYIELLNINKLKTTDLIEAYRSKLKNVLSEQRIAILNRPARIVTCPNCHGHNLTTKYWDIDGNTDNTISEKLSWWEHVLNFLKGK